MIIEPINRQQEQEVIEETKSFLQRASVILEQVLPSVPVYFDLKGRAAGMYRTDGRRRWIRYNPWLFARDFQENLRLTVPHEVAHYVVDRLHGLRNVKPHGREWREVMQWFGVEARATADYGLEGIPLRSYRYFAYRCDCKAHQLGSIRHNRIRRGERRYYCRRCRGELKPVEPGLTAL